MDRESAEREVAELVALRAADPDGEIDDARMRRGFDVAEARAKFPETKET